jgi:hypothetical protein
MELRLPLSNHVRASRDKKNSWLIQAVNHEYSRSGKRIRRFRAAALAPAGIGGTPFRHSGTPPPRFG